MKSHEVKGKSRNFNYGFMDPYQINEPMVTTPAMIKHTEEQLLKYFVNNEFKSKIFLPYNFR